jgi:catechol 2,3-dioxygenase-like lactoylglutathione lyase family enzyme
VASDHDFPGDGVEVTLLLVVSDLERARRFYRDVLGATETREYGGTSAVLRFAGTWLLLVTGGGPTVDKPTVTFAPPASTDIVSHELTIRVADCRAAYETLMRRGATFLTPPVEYDWEVRCFFRDPDGNLLEISQSKAAPFQA